MIMPHDPLTMLGFFVCLALCLYIFWASLYYFFKVKMVWRWIKLAYAFNSLVVGWIIILAAFNLCVIGEDIIILVTTMLLSTIASGLMVAQVKLNLIKRLPNDN
jgi:hypothetical protein